MDTFLPSSYDDPSRANLWTPKMSPDNLFPSGSEPSHVSTEQYWSVGSKGFVLWNHRAAYNLKCKFDYSEMPFDEQTCTLRTISTPSETLQRQRFVTADVSPLLEAEETLSAMSSTEWECTRITATTGVSQPPGMVRKYSYLDVTFTFKRHHEWYIKNVVTPAVLLVVISWASFFISRAAVPARVAMGIICYLTLSNLVTSILAQLPKVSKSVRLIDLLQHSKYFVLFSIVEYAIANWLMRMEARVQKARDKAEKAAAEALEAEPSPTSVAETNGEPAKVEPANVVRSPTRIF
jgi:hypothetical protein